MMRRATLVAFLVLGLAGGAAYAQRRYFGEGNYPPKFAPAEGIPTSGVVFCRLMYSSVRPEPMGVGWRTDYPGAENNLAIRTSELTKTRIDFEAPNEPSHFVVRLKDDPSLFQCPFVLASDVGTIGLSGQEAERLGDYLRKGGFLWVDDFWGEAAWEQWSREIGKALPPAQYPIADVPPGDSIYRMLFQIARMPQITNIQYWRQTGGMSTSERGRETDEGHLRAIRDEHGRIMVLMTHNTDIADSWEREGEDPAFFYQFSPNGYAFAMNVVVSVLSH